jgi:hypothetical protein
MSVLRVSFVLVLLCLIGGSTALVARAQGTTNVQITVDSTKTIRTVDPRTFAVNTAVWDSAVNTDATRTLLGAARIRALRFPGGSTSDTYHWLTNKSDGNSFTWATSFDDFAKVAIPLGAQVFITINYGSGTVQEGADWVQYSNVTKGYGFKYWEIGNECYGSWENDTHTAKWDPYTYAQQAQAYAAAMKAVDPTIKIGVVIVTGEDSYNSYSTRTATNPRTGQVHKGWTPVMLTTLKSLGLTPDFVIYHRYEQGPGQESDAGLLQAAATWKNDAANLRQQITDYMGPAGAGIELVCTENNSVYTNPGKQSTSLVNGLYLADSTGQILQTEFNSLVWWDLRNGPSPNNNNSPSLYGWRQYGDYGIMSDQGGLYPTYYVHKLLSHFARGGEQMVAASSNNTLVSAYGALGTDGTLELLAINKDPANDASAQIEISGYTPGGNTTVYSYGIPQDKAAKTGSGSPDVSQAPFAGASASFTYTFPAYSATILSMSTGPAPTGPTISAVQFDGRKNVMISGSGFGSAPQVLINEGDVTGFVRAASDALIKIKAKARFLGLHPGDNMIQVIGPGGAGSNVFTLTL